MERGVGGDGGCVCSTGTEDGMGWDGWVFAGRGRSGKVAGEMWGEGFIGAMVVVGGCSSSGLGGMDAMLKTNVRGRGCRCECFGHWGQASEVRMGRGGVCGEDDGPRGSGVYVR